jgi:hypothetical protein
MDMRAFGIGTLSAAPRRLALTGAALAAAATLAVPGVASAAPGDVDPGFASPSIAAPRVLATDAQDRVLVAEAAGGTVRIERLTAAGAVDGTFAPVSLGVAMSSFFGLRAGPDDSVFAAYDDGGPRLARWNADGTPDAGYGSGGVVDLGASGSSVGAWDLAPDGAAVAAVGPAGARNTVVRVTPTGDLDSGFGTDGAVTLPSYGTTSWAASVLALPSGGVLVSVYVSYRPTVGPGYSRSLALRLTAAGAVGEPEELTYGGLGLLAARPDGTVLTGSGYGVGRLTPSGELDPAYGTPSEGWPGLGVVSVATLSPAFPYSPSDEDAAVAPDGSLIVAVVPPRENDSFDPLPGTDAGFPRQTGGGDTPAPETADRLVARFTPDGAFDCGYGVRGVSRVGTGDGAALRRGLAVDREGRALVGTPGGVTRLLGGAGGTQLAPVALTEAFSGSRPGGGYVRAWVDPGCQDTTWRVEYGTTTAYGQSVAGTTVSGRGTGQQVLLPFEGLQPGVTYHMRAVAENPSGVSRGADMTVVVPAAELHGPGPKPPTATATVSRTLSVRGRSLRLRLRCSVAPCSVGVRVARGHRTVVSTTVRLKTTKATTVSLRLSKRAYRALPSGKRVALTLRTRVAGRTTSRPVVAVRR